MSERLIARFREEFGGEPRLFRAPGRINIIGEHVDYAGCLVMPAAIDRWCTVAIAPNGTRTLTVFATAFDERITLAFDELAPRKSWIDYVAGVASVLEREGIELPGCDMIIESDVPIGAGVSSSAALEVSVTLALLTLAGVKSDRVEIACWAQKAENQFVGVPCGIMDQFASVNGRADCAMLLDCRDLSVEYMALPRSVTFLIVNSMIKHALVDGEYRARRDDVEAAGRYLGKHWAHQSNYPPRALLDLPQRVAQRAMHVMTENARVRDAVDALVAGDMPKLGQLMNQSHQSLRLNMEVSTRELDDLADIARATPGVFGARLMGGGFGGSIIALVRTDAADAARETIQRSYSKLIGKLPDALICRAVDGAAEVTA